MKSPGTLVIGVLVFLGLSLGVVSGAEPVASTPEAILQQGVVKQEQLKVTTKRVGDQLSAIINEFERNGISGEDVKVLKSVQSVLDKLSETEMEKVVKFLQQSRAAGNSAESIKTATEAYATQKSIVVQLQQLVLEYQRQQALYEISLRLKELATRQTANMWLGVGLAKATEGRTGFSAFDENQRISLRYQQSEQNPLRDEVAAILAKLERLAKDSDEGPSGERPKVALERAKTGGLTLVLGDAARDLSEDNLKLLSAIGNEKKARDELREIARLLAFSQDRTEALRQAILELDRAIDAQKALTTETGKTRKREEAEKHATEQAALVDDTDLIRKDIDSLAPIAAENLKSAIDKMQEARANLSGSEELKRRLDEAVPQQEAALLQMQTARRSLEEQLAAAEAVEPQAKSPLEALQQMQEQIRDLIEKQQALKQEAAATEPNQLPKEAAKQGELKDQAQALQSGAADRSPTSALSLGEAAGQMQKAQNSLARQENNAPAQQAAIDALEKAAQQLAQDIAQLEQAEKDLAQMEELMKKLVALIEEQQKVNLETAQQEGKNPPDPAPSKGLATRQEKLETETESLQQEAASAVPAGASHLGDARQQMHEAKAELDKPALDLAQPRQKEALAALYRAQKEFQNRMNELEEKLGMPQSPDADSLAEAQRRIQEAQKQVNEALENLQQAPPGLLEALQKQQQEIAEALRQLRQETKDAGTLVPAEQAAGEAADQLARSDLPRAISAMQAARNGIEQAQQARPAQPPPDKGSPALPELGRQQAEVQKAAESLLAAQKNAPPSAMQSAAQSLQNANSSISPITSGALGQMPAGAQSALQSAQESTAKGSGHASAGQSSPAQQQANAAAKALAQAQSALALAQAGVGSQAASGQQDGQGKGQGQKQGRGQAQGRGQGQGQGKGQPSPQGDGNRGNWTGTGGSDGPRANTAGSSSFTRLPGRDRAALQQSQSEKYPQEYGPLVEQYLRNLSEQSGDK